MAPLAHHSVVGNMREVPAFKMFVIFEGGPLHSGKTTAPKVHISEAGRGD